MRLHDYLRRIGVEDGLPATVDTLRRLHIAHREAFLFENVSIQTGGAISVELGAIERKFIDEGRGGYCFEHNTLFAAVLRDLGFAPVALLGRVRRGPPERWARTHMVLRVPVDGHDWLADVGFGGVGLLEPILLREGPVAEQAGLAYTLRREPGLWVLSFARPVTDAGPLRVQRGSADRGRRRGRQPFHVDASRFGVSPHADDSAIGPRRPPRPARRHADAL